MTSCGRLKSWKVRRLESWKVRRLESWNVRFGQEAWQDRGAAVVLFPEKADNEVKKDRQYHWNQNGGGQRKIESKVPISEADIAG